MRIPPDTIPEEALFSRKEISGLLHDLNRPEKNLGQISSRGVLEVPELFFSKARALFTEISAALSSQLQKPELAEPWGSIKSTLAKMDWALGQNNAQGFLDQLDMLLFNLDRADPRFAKWFGTYEQLQGILVQGLGRSEVRASPLGNKAGVKGQWFLNHPAGATGTKLGAVTAKPVYFFPPNSPYYPLTQAKRITWEQARPFIDQDQKELEAIASDVFGDAKQSQHVLNMIVNRMTLLRDKASLIYRSGSQRRDFEDGKYSVQISRIADGENTDVQLLYRYQGQERIVRLNQFSIDRAAMGVFDKGLVADSLFKGLNSSPHWDQVYPFSPREFYEHHVVDQFSKMDLITRLLTSHFPEGTRHGGVLLELEKIYERFRNEGQSDQAIQAVLDEVFLQVKDARRDGFLINPFKLILSIKTVRDVQPLVQQEIAVLQDSVEYQDYKKLKAAIPDNAVTKRLAVEGYSLSTEVRGHQAVLLIRTPQRVVDFNFGQIINDPAKTLWDNVFYWMLDKGWAQWLPLNWRVSKAKEFLDQMHKLPLPSYEIRPYYHFGSYFLKKVAGRSEVRAHRSFQWQNRQVTFSLRNERSAFFGGESKVIKRRDALQQKLTWAFDQLTLPGLRAAAQQTQQLTFASGHISISRRQSNIAFTVYDALGQIVVTGDLYDPFPDARPRSEVRSSSALEAEVAKKMIYPADKIYSPDLVLDVYDREHYEFVASKDSPGQGFWQRKGMPAGKTLVLGTWQAVERKYAPVFQDDQTMKRHVVTRYKDADGKTRSFYFYDDHAFSVPYTREAVERSKANLEVLAQEGLTHLFLDDHSDRARVPDDSPAYPHSFSEAIQLMTGIKKDRIEGLRMNNFNEFWAPGLLRKHFHVYDSFVALPSNTDRLLGELKVERPLPGGAAAVSIDMPIYFSPLTERPLNDRRSVFADIDTDVNGGGDRITKPMRSANDIFSFYNDFFGDLIFTDKVIPALFHASTTSGQSAPYGDVEVVRYLARIAALYTMLGETHSLDEILAAAAAIGEEHKPFIGLSRSEVRVAEDEMFQVLVETARKLLDDLQLDVAETAKNDIATALAHNTHLPDTGEKSNFLNQVFPTAI
ncbi:MAG: hypothetical protein KBC91_07605, partial [Candidatus Omnitrophica bacterium]|nr:hypothetical protein [Candidatus Omnitrophota bacterium]